MTWFIRETLDSIVLRLKKTFPERLKGIYIFGSRIRGDHGEWSDLDVLIVVKDKDLMIEKEIIDIFVEERLNTGIPFSPLIKDFEVFEKERELNTPFYQSLSKEGVDLLKESSIVS